VKPIVKRQKGKLNSKILFCVSPTILLFTVFSYAQQPAKIHRVGFLTGGFGGPTFGIDALRRELRALGYVEGKNISFEYRYAEDKPERSPALADELVRLKVDVIVASGNSDTLAAKTATKTIPIVFLDSAADPAAIGLVDSLARPGGNITGFTTMAGIVAGKRLELLKEAIPQLSRVAVLWNPQAPANELQWKESQLVARQLRLQLHSMEVSSTDQYENAFKEAIKAGSAALAVTRYRLSTTYQQQIITLAAKYRVPAIHYREDFVTKGGLMSYGADEVEPFKRAASMVDKILKGVRPADIPVEQPTKFELAINLKTARELGLTIPPNVLARADRVIR
jgi:putative ABC transport system substrate-binding protein